MGNCISVRNITFSFIMVLKYVGWKMEMKRKDEECIVEIKMRFRIKNEERKENDKEWEDKDKETRKRWKKMNGWKVEDDEGKKMKNKGIKGNGGRTMSMEKRDGEEEIWKKSRDEERLRIEEWIWEEIVRDNWNWKGKLKIRVEIRIKMRKVMKNEKRKERWKGGWGMWKNMNNVKEDEEWKEKDEMGSGRVKDELEWKDENDKDWNKKRRQDIF